MSKFDKIFKAREEEIDETQNPESPTAGKTIPAAGSKPQQKSSSNALGKGASRETEQAPQTVSQVDVLKKRGRPGGKRTDPDFIGFTTYIRKDTHLKAKIALLQEGKGKELSELVEELISKWLEDK